MRILAVILLVIFVSACSHPVLTPEEKQQQAYHLNSIEKITDEGEGEFTVRVIGETALRGRELPLHLISRPAVGEGQKHILILAEPVIGNYRASEIVMETARQIIADPSLYGRNAVDLMPMLSAEVLRPVQDQRGGGWPDLSLRQQQALERTLARHFQDYSYDLVILHRVEPVQVGFAVAQKNGMEDEAAFILSRLRDNGYFIASHDTRKGGDRFAKGSLERFLLRKSGAPVMVFSSWVGEDKEKALYQHLLAQETVTRLLIQSFYR